MPIGWPGCCCPPTEEPFPICTDWDGVPLYLTDANGTHAMTHISGDSYYCSYQFQPSKGTVSTVGGLCIKDPTGSAWVLYTLDCITPGGVTTARLFQVFAVNSDPCGAPPTHPYQLFHRSDSAPAANIWPASNAGNVEQDTYPLANPDALEFTFPATGTNGPPFNDPFDYPAPGLVTITT
jgi:hypothetical protein